MASSLRSSRLTFCVTDAEHAELNRRSLAYGAATLTHYVMAVLFQIPERDAKRYIRTYPRRVQGRHKKARPDSSQV